MTEPFDGIESAALDVHQASGDHPTFKRIAQFSLSVALIMALLVPIAIRSAGNAADTSQDVADQSDATACYGIFAIDVTDAQAEVDEARVLLERLNTDLLIAAIGRDINQVTVIAGPGGEREQRVAVVDRAVRHKRRAVDRQKAAAKLRRDHPERFLDDCRKAAR